MKKITFPTNLKIILLILIFVSSNCERYKSDRFVNNTPFTVRTNESIEISDNLNFIIEKVSDSRCPTGVICIWAGNVVLSFKIIQNTSQVDTMICDSYCHNNPFNLTGYTWEILEVTPYPDIRKNIRQSDYKIKMLIKQN
jgi:hypothetical protein